MYDQLGIVVKERPDAIVSVTSKMKIQIKHWKGNNYTFVDSDLRKESQKEQQLDAGYLHALNFASLVYYFHDYVIYCFSVLSFQDRILIMNLIISLSFKIMYTNRLFSWHMCHINLHT